MRYGYSQDSVNSTSIGRENPEGLKTILGIQITTALGFRLRAKVNEHAPKDCSSDGLIPLVGDRPANAINFVTADLTGVGPNIGRAVTRCEFGSLCCLDFHEAGQGPQTGDHRNLMVMNFKAVKAEGDCTVGAVCRALH